MPLSEYGPRSIDIKLRSGEVLTYVGPKDNHLGSVSLTHGKTDIKATLDNTEDGQLLAIGSDSIFTFWYTHGWKMSGINITPRIMENVGILSIISMTIKKEGVFASLHEVRDSDHIMLVEKGLTCQGVEDTEWKLDYSKKIRISSEYFPSSLTFWLDWEQKEDQIVIDTGRGNTEWIWYTRTMNMETLRQLLLPRPVHDQRWSETVTDLLTKFRYQIIQSEL